MRDSVPQSRELTDSRVSCRQEWDDAAGGGLGIWYDPTGSHPSRTLSPKTCLNCNSRVPFDRK